MSWSHRLATLEPSPSFVAVTPISKSTANQSSRSSPFEQRLAKFRSLPLLWWRTCGASHTQPKRRPPIGTIGNNTIYSTFGQFGELNHPQDLLFEDIVPLQRNMLGMSFKIFSFPKQLHIFRCFAMPIE